MEWLENHVHLLSLHLIKFRSSQRTNIVKELIDITNAKKEKNLHITF